jgi:ATP-dependent DNA helicase DinG
MPKHDYISFFPFSKIRKEQKEAIEFAIDAYESGKRFVVLELGTGVGKSAIGITVAGYMQTYGHPIKNEQNEDLTGSYIVTTQKILQDQYLRDFGLQSGKCLVKSIKSSTNYKCSFYPDQSCAESKRILSRLGKQLNGTEFQKQCKQSCKYSIEKQEFIDSPISVTNFPYILAESTYSGKLDSRSLLVIDEAHNIESEVSKFIEITFSEKFIKDILKCKLPKHDEQHVVFDWIKTTYKKSLKKNISELEKLLSKAGTDIDGYGALSKQYELLEKHNGKLEQFVDSYNPKNWTMNIVSNLDQKRPYKKYEFKPIDISSFSQVSLFRLGGRVLMMSATIIDNEIFCQSLGLRREDVAFLSIPSPFPIENRPIHYIPVGSMSKACIDSTLPKLTEAINLLLEKHSKEKGIIHCTNFKIAKYIQENIKNKRIMIHDSNNREEILNFHIKSEDPTVLLSPSMAEGVDLHGDLSRFQIICKVPYPYLGDVVVQKRMEKNKQWYPYMTAKTVIQSLGRSIRNEKDFAVSYILDSDWERFYRQNKKMFPVEFRIE